MNKSSSLIISFPPYGSQTFTMRHPISRHLKFSRRRRLNIKLYGIWGNREEECDLHSLGKIRSIRLFFSVSTANLTIAELTTVRHSFHPKLLKPIWTTRPNQPMLSLHFASLSNMEKAKPMTWLWVFYGKRSRNNPSGQGWFGRQPWWEGIVAAQLRSVAPLAHLY